MDPHPPIVPESGDAPRLPTPRSVLLLLGLVVLLYFVVGVPLQFFLGEPGLALTQLGIFLGVTLLFVRRGGYDPTATLALRVPQRRQVLGGILLLAGAVPVAWILAWLQSQVIQVPVELLEAMRGFLETDDPLRILWLLFLVALVPAVGRHAPRVHPHRERLESETLQGVSAAGRPSSPAMTWPGPARAVHARTTGRVAGPISGGTPRCSPCGIRRPS
jgi:hypothetical protein